MIECIEQYTFGLNGSVLPCLGKGWSLVELDFTWTLGTKSSLTLPLPEQFETLVLEFEIRPHTTPPMLRRQRLNLTVNAVPIADITIGVEGPIAFELPEAATKGARALEIELYCPDAATPEDLGVSGDDRPLALGIRRIMVFTMTPRPPFKPLLKSRIRQMPGGLAKAIDDLTGLPVPDLAGRFESLGHNCEFGVVQRAMGSEPLSLLRFSGIMPHKLAEGLDLEFDGLDEAGNLTTYVDDESSEYMVRDKRYGTTFHTHIATSKAAPDDVLKIFDRNMRLLRRKFLEDLRNGGKIFVLQHPEIRTVAHARPYLNLLRSHGPNILLFVTEGTEEQSGSVAYLEPDLLQGWVRQLAPFNKVLGADVRPWIQICANAYSLCRDQGTLHHPDDAA